MDNIFSSLNEAFNLMSNWEILAASLSIIYLLMAIKQNIWCWAAAFISTLIYTILFFDASLLMSSFLNAYYLLMAIYGFYSWKFANNKKNKELEISSYGLKKNLIIISSLAIISFFVGFYMQNYTDAVNAYLDSTITVFALFATFMMTRKILENWLYWIVIDTSAVYLYINQEFYVTALLMVIYTVLAAIAYFEWKRELKSES
ncbi:nicotinamide riboside transporter PnuC [Arcobacter vandammei]|uniref:nicotinamide riboside transporter PnuC n=1 Tax=Arcobacter vandammei TaxID=2782243 RepID=UPI001D1915EE|nr:nicotinamide riboside transporter PnuC [Arcobacter vandammei]